MQNRVFGRKSAQKEFSVPEFGRLIREFDAMRTIPIRDRSAEATRIRRILCAPDIEAVADEYGQQIAASKAKLDTQLAIINDYLRSVGMSPTVVPFMLVPPSVWTEHPVGNQLMYGLGLSPFDPWNQILVSAHPVSAIDLDMGVSDERKTEMLTADFAARYGELVSQWAPVEASADLSKDPGQLVVLAEQQRRQIDREAREDRKMIAWHLFPLRDSREPSHY